MEQTTVKSKNTETAPCREIYYIFPDLHREYDGKDYTIGVNFIMAGDDIVSVTYQVRSSDQLTGANQSKLVFGYITAAIDYIYSLGRDKA